MTDNIAMLNEPTEHAEDTEYLLFRLLDESYAVSILQIREILEYSPVTVVPMMPPCLRGVINLRGKVVPVIDLAVRFGGQPCVPGRRSCIVIVELEFEGEQQEFGLLVDAVSQVVDIPRTAVSDAPSLGSTINTNFIAGMGRVEGAEGGFVICLRLEKVLAPEDLSEMRAVVSSHQAAA